MPRLLLFVACEKVIISTENTPTLVEIFETLTMGVVGVKLLENAAFPLKWHAYSMWHGEPADIDGSFEQRCTLKAPSGKLLFDVTMAFRMEKPSHRNSISFPVFPISEPGQHELSAFLRSEGHSDWGKPVAVWPLEVVHIPPPAGTGEAAATTADTQ